MSREYDDYLTKHIQAVKACFGLFPFWKECGYELTEHDISKYSEEEYCAYDDYFYPKKDSYGLEKERFQYAWLHHQNANKHHWQYWVLINDEDGIEALKIPTIYIYEMVSDWGSFAYQKQDGSELIKWYESHKDKMILHEGTRRKVEELVPELARLIDEHFGKDKEDT